MGPVNQTVLVTGALGFVASRLIPRLLERGSRVVGLVRTGRDGAPLESRGVDVRRVDLGQRGALSRGALDEVDHVVHLAGLALVPGMLPALETASIRHGVFVSSAGVHTKLVSRSADLKREGERALEASQLSYTILRPSMIYGTPRDRNVVRLLQWIERFPVLPLPGGGSTLQQPVHVDDLVAAILAALDRRSHPRGAYEVGGPEPMSLAQLIDACAKALGRRVWKLPLPLGPAYAAAVVARRARLPFPARPEQVLRLHESKAVDIEPARRDLAFAPRSFEAGVRDEVVMLRTSG